MQKLHNISVCVWDFDGTLYQQMSGLWDSITESEYQVIMNHTGWSREKAIEEFGKVHKVVTPSGTKSVSLITGISVPQAAVETSQLTKYEDFLKPDPELGTMFASLSHYTHYMLVNGSMASVTRGLALLGVSKEYFKTIITSDLVGETKPSTKGFEYLLKQTGLPPDAHVMIGDREMVDLAPAKSLGMRTCLVWSGEKSKIADVVLSTVYEIPDVLG